MRSKKWSGCLCFATAGNLKAFTIFMVSPYEGCTIELKAASGLTSVLDGQEFTTPSRARGNRDHLQIRLELAAEKLREPSKRTPVSDHLPTILQWKRTDRRCIRLHMHQVLIFRRQLWRDHPQVCRKRQVGYSGENMYHSQLWSHGLRYNTVNRTSRKSMNDFVFRANRNLCLP